MAKFFYDTEFIDNGETIELISIGIVCEDGREYYAVNSDVELVRIVSHDWLAENVLPHLPVKWEYLIPHKPTIRTPSWDDRCEDLKPRWVIAHEVKNFLLSGDSNPRLYAWYCAYDHVVLAQLWGPMSGLPEGIPKNTFDLKQECERLGNPKTPQDNEDLHNALGDARWNKRVHDWLAEIERSTLRNFVMDPDDNYIGYPSLLR